MTFKYRYRKQIAFCIITIFLLCGGIGGFIFYQNTYQKKSKVERKEVLLASKKTFAKKTSTIDEEEKDAKKMIKVDIKGQVNMPGLYTLEEGNRVSDVIALAGGLTDLGDTTVINLSKKITDEMVIIIYSKEEVAEFKRTKEILAQVLDRCKNAYEGVVNNACIENKDQTQEENKSTNLISINQATMEEFLTLPGIGEAKAHNIIRYRETNGDFTSIEQLKEVNGIGDSIFDKIKENITL